MSGFISISIGVPVETYKQFTYHHAPVSNPTNYLNTHIEKCGQSTSLWFHNIS